MSKGQAKQFKSDRYSAKDDTDELEVISDKLAVDLRKSIRQLVSQVITTTFEKRFVFLTISSSFVFVFADLNLSVHANCRKYFRYCRIPGFRWQRRLLELLIYQVVY